MGIINIKRENGGRSKTPEPKTLYELDTEYDFPFMPYTDRKGFLAQIFGGYHCVYCGKNDGFLHIDHIIPTSRNGSEHLWNCVLACFACNTLKSGFNVKRLRELAIDSPSLHLRPKYALLSDKLDVLLTHYYDLAFVPKFNSDITIPDIPYNKLEAFNANCQLGKLFQTRLDELGWSRERFKKEYAAQNDGKVSRMFPSRYFSGQHKPRYATLQKMCAAVGWTIEDVKTAYDYRFGKLPKPAYLGSDIVRGKWRHNMELATELRKIRYELQLTQKELAVKLDIRDFITGKYEYGTAPVIGEIECGRKKITLDILSRYFFRIEHIDIERIEKIIKIFNKFEQNYE